MTSERCAMEDEDDLSFIILHSSFIAHSLNGSNARSALAAR